MKFGGIAAACALAVATLGFVGCSSGGSSAASPGEAHSAATGRVTGDNGKLLPTVSCWVDAGNTSGGDSSVIAVVNPNGGKADCNAVISDLNKSLPTGYAASITTPLSQDQMDPSNVTCSGSYDGYRVTSVLTDGTGMPGEGMAVCGALGLGS